VLIAWGCSVESMETAANHPSAGIGRAQPGDFFEGSEGFAILPGLLSAEGSPDLLTGFGTRNEDGASVEICLRHSRHRAKDIVSAPPGCARTLVPRAVRPYTTLRARQQDSETPPPIHSGHGGSGRWGSLRRRGAAGGVLTQFGLDLDYRARPMRRRLRPLGRWPRRLPNHLGELLVGRCEDRADQLLEPFVVAVLAVDGRRRHHRARRACIAAKQLGAGPWARRRTYSFAARHPWLETRRPRRGHAEISRFSRRSGHALYRPSL
jgi:hypothetical protein